MTEVAFANQRGKDGLCDKWARAMVCTFGKNRISSQCHTIQRNKFRRASVAQLVKDQTVDTVSGHDRAVVRLSPVVSPTWGSSLNSSRAYNLQRLVPTIRKESLQINYKRDKMPHYKLLNVCAQTIFRRRDLNI